MVKERDTPDDPNTSWLRTQYRLFSDGALLKCLTVRMRGKQAAGYASDLHSYGWKRVNLKTKITEDVLESDLASKGFSRDVSNSATYAERE
jgi:hypothetical protein